MRSIARFPLPVLLAIAVPFSVMPCMALPIVQSSITPFGFPFGQGSTPPCTTNQISDSSLTVTCDATGASSYAPASATVTFDPTAIIFTGTFGHLSTGQGIWALDVYGNAGLSGTIPITGGSGPAWLDLDLLGGGANLTHGLMTINGKMYQLSPPSPFGYSWQDPWPSPEHPSQYHLHILTAYGSSVDWGISLSASTSFLWDGSRLDAELGFNHVTITPAELSPEPSSLVLMGVPLLLIFYFHRSNS